MCGLIVIIVVLAALVRLLLKSAEYYKAKLERSEEYLSTAGKIMDKRAEEIKDLNAKLQFWKLVDRERSCKN